MIRINAFVSIVLGCLLAASGAQAQTASITVLSSSPALVSGGDALIAISGDGAVMLNGADVTAAFKAKADGKRIGLVEGLKPGGVQQTRSHHFRRPVRLC